MKEGYAIRAADTVRSDRAGRRVLIADDDPLIRMDLTEMPSAG